MTTRKWIDCAFVAGLWLAGTLVCHCAGSDDAAPPAGSDDPAPDAGGDASLVDRAIPEDATPYDAFADAGQDAATPESEWRRHGPQQGQVSSVWGMASNDVWIGGLTGVSHWNGRTWTETALRREGGGAGDDVVALTGAAAQDLWAVSSHGIWHFDGTNWSVGLSAASKRLRSGWAIARDDVWAVGDTTYHYDGSKWTQFELPAGTPQLHAVWGAARNDVWAVGYQGAIVHFDGVGWTQSASPAGSDFFFDIHGAAKNDVWAVSYEGGLYHFTGSSFVREAGPPGGTKFESVLALPGGELWIGGPHGTLFHRVSGAWQTVDLGTSDGIRALRQTSTTNLWAVGQFYTAFEWTGSNWYCRGFTSTTDYTDITGINADDVWMTATRDPAYATDQPRGEIWHLGKDGWRLFQKTPEPLYAITATGPKDVWFAGDLEVVYRYNGAAFTRVGAPVTVEPGRFAFARSLWAPEPGKVWMGTYGGKIRGYDGASWSDIYNGGTPIDALWGFGAANVWAGMAFDMMHRTGGSWAPGGAFGANDYWGSTASDLWAAGTSGIVHYDGSAWKVATPLSSHATAVGGASREDVWAVSNDELLHFDGRAWARDPAYVRGAHELWLDASGEGWMVGKGSLWSRRYEP